MLGASMLSNRVAELGSMYPVAIIPARGGSKGIPRKNLQLVGGQPLIVRAIETCQRATSVCGVYVSTDDAEIAEVASEAGAAVVWRPAELAADDTSSDVVLLHAIDLLPRPLPLAVCFVQCTAPLLTADEIDATVRRLLESGADVAVAATEDHGFRVRPGYAGRVRGVGWELSEAVKRRQDLGEEWTIAGSVWALDVAAFVARGRLYSENTVVSPVGWKLDIDTPADLALARVLLDPARERAAEEMPRVYYPH